jgi:hypothetical protein
MPDNDEEAPEDCFGPDVLTVRDVLERLEAKLLETGQDEMIFSTSHGSWTWQRAPN